MNYILSITKDCEYIHTLGVSMDIFNGSPKKSYPICHKFNHRYIVDTFNIKKRFKTSFYERLNIRKDPNITGQKKMDTLFIKLADTD